MKCCSQDLWRHFAVVFHTGWKSEEHAPGLWKCGGKYFLYNVNSLLHKTIFVLGRLFHFEDEMGRLNTWHVKLYLSGIPSDALERDNPYYFFSANQQKPGTKIYSLPQCSLNVNECDWYILAGNDERINSHCLTRCIRNKVWKQIHSQINSIIPAFYVIWMSARVQSPKNVTNYSG